MPKKGTEKYKVTPEEAFLLELLEEYYEKSEPGTPIIKGDGSLVGTTFAGRPFEWMSMKAAYDNKVLNQDFDVKVKFEGHPPIEARGLTIHIGRAAGIMRLGGDVFLWQRNGANIRILSRIISVECRIGPKYPQGVIDIERINKDGLAIAQTYFCT